MRMVTLGETGRYINGAAFKPTDWTDSGLPIIRIQNLTGTGEKFNYTTRTVKSELTVEPGDLLLSWSATLDVYRWNGPRGLLNQHIFRVLPADGVDADYLFYALKSVLIQLQAKTHGSTMKHITRGDFEKTCVPLPPLPDQRRIVDVLARAEGLVRLHREAVAKTREIIPALFLDIFGDPAGNPKGWPVERFGSLATCRLGKMLDKKKQTGLNRRRYLGNANVRWGSFDLVGLKQMDFSEDDRREFALRQGDLLICEGGEVGRCAIWRGELDECYFQKALHRARPDPSKCCSEFLEWHLWFAAHAGQLARESAISTIAHLTGVILERLSVPLPPLSLQTCFAEHVARIRGIQAQAESALAKSQAAFQALLHRAFSG